MDGIIKLSCDWCGNGWIRTDHICGKCGRSDDFEYEKYVKKIQDKCDGNETMWTMKPVRKATGFYDMVNFEALPTTSIRHGQGPYRRRKI